MTKNEGSIDRTVRIALGVLLVALAVVGRRTAWSGPLALVLLASGLVGFCLIYRVFGTRACPAAT